MWDAVLLLSIAIYIRIFANKQHVRSNLTAGVYAYLLKHNTGEIINTCGQEIVK